MRTTAMQVEDSGNDLMNIMIRRIFMEYPKKTWPQGQVFLPI